MLVFETLIPSFQTTVLNAYKSNLLSTFSTPMPPQQGFGAVQVQDYLNLAPMLMDTSTCVKYPSLGKVQSCSKNGSGVSLTCLLLLSEMYPLGMSNNSGMVCSGAFLICS
ncbi:hypothetical protein AAG906_025211 [Vitis piasezkii]